jgi:hypothetical protein
MQQTLLVACLTLKGSNTHSLNLGLKQLGEIDFSQASLRKINLPK